MYNSDQVEEIDDNYVEETTKTQNYAKKSIQDELIEKNYGILEKYPPYKIKPIKWNPPPAYFQPKRQTLQPQEYTPPKKKPSREVNPDHLSESQRQLYGKSLYEKDLEIIKNKNSQIERQNTRRKKRSESANLGKKPPDIYFREEAERQQKNEELQRFGNQIKRKNRKKELRQKKQFEKEKRKIDEIKAARDYDKKIEFEIYEEERRKEIKRRIDYINSIHIQSDRPTRASALKEETSKKKIQSSAIEERRKQINQEMKKEILKEETKKIASVVDEINPKIKSSEKIKMKKHELQKNERGWYKWLALTEQTNKMRETMIERIYAKYDI